jgi:hypothetical protein
VELGESVTRLGLVSTAPPEGLAEVVIPEATDRDDELPAFNDEPN